MNAFRIDKRPDGVAVLTFDLPGEKVNKLTAAAMEELDRLLEELGQDRSVRALVFASGKPDTFIAGADIAEIRDITDAGLGERLSRKGQAVFRKIEELPFPTVAAVHGACLGGGLELALACDFRVISNDPRTVLGQPEVRLGIMPGFGGTQRLPRLVGIANGLELILTGKNVHPKKARRIGLTDVVTYREHVLERAIETAKHAVGRERFRTVRARRSLGLRLLESNPLTRPFLFRKAEQSVLAETAGNYPAPLAALDAVRTGYRLGIEAGYEREAKLIGELIASETAKNLIHVYYLNEALKKGPVARTQQVSAAVVIGAGVMGGGIAQLLAEKGIGVRLKDVSPKAVGAGLKAAADLFAKRVKKGILEPLQARDGMDRIAGTTDPAGYSSVDIAVEAVVESMPVKQQVLREFEARSRPDAIFASNTSSLSITEMASASARPERVVGMHFFNPVEKMPLVEVVRGKRTAPEAVDAVAALSRRLGKLPVVVNDGPGFLVNRILMPYLGEALRMLEEGGGSVKTIDDALMRFGMPMGAFILLDEIGIDVASKVSEILRQGLGGRLGSSPLLAALAHDGSLGRKNGKGFYRYEGGRRTFPDPAVAARISKKDGARPALAPDEIVDRAVLLMVKEAALCLEEGIVSRPDLLDAALVFGIGFPPFRGGLLRWADRLGAATVVEKLNALAAAHGERFSPPSSLFELSRNDLIARVAS
jgi:3-hydroxyacyl-CoA dehydrogenase/enoyl-CoA hydratase/3-hydroxybutyryl-CoA epimerase